MTCLGAGNLPKIGKLVWVWEDFYTLFDVGDQLFTGRCAEAVLIPE